MNYQNELVAILTINVEFDGVLKYRRSLWMPNINTIWRTITITQQNVETPARTLLDHPHRKYGLSKQHHMARRLTRRSV